MSSRSVADLDSYRFSGKGRKTWQHAAPGGAQITLAPIVLIKAPRRAFSSTVPSTSCAPLPTRPTPTFERTDINAATYQAGQLDVIARRPSPANSAMVIIRDLKR